MLTIKSSTDLRNSDQAQAARLENSREELYHLLAEGRAAVEAGHTQPFREFMDDFEQRIADGSIYS